MKQVDCENVRTVPESNGWCARRMRLYDSANPVRILLFSLALFSLLICLNNAAYAGTTYQWSGNSSGNWNDASNWIPSSGYPGSSGSTTDTAIVNTSGAAINFAGSVTISQFQSTDYGVTGININLTGTTSMLTIADGLIMNQPDSASVVLTFSGSGIANINGRSTFSYGSSFTIASGCTVAFLSGSYLDWSSTQGVITNDGTLSFTSSTLELGSFTALIDSGTLVVSNSNFNISGTPAYITYAGKFVADSSSFTLPTLSYLKSIASTSSFTATACTFTLSGSGGSGTYIYNNGTFRDHGSTYTLTGQNAYIQNTGSGSSMHLSGTTVNLNSIGGTTGQNINNSSIFTADSASKINAIAKKSGITNTGTFNAGMSNSPCIITLSGANTFVTNSGIFNLAPASVINPGGSAAVITNSGTGVFTLQSDANGSAAIGALSSTGAINGIFNVQRFFQGGATYNSNANRWAERNYRIISSPVNTGTKVNGNYVWGLNYIVGATAGQTTNANSTTNAFVTGAAGGSTASGNSSLILYREDRLPSNIASTSGNFVGITDITNSTSAGTITARDGGTCSIPIGNGVFFFFRGNASNFTARTNFPYVAPENVALTSTGYINQQQVTVTNWFTPTSPYLSYSTGISNASVRGFNLVGNPYPSSIDWNTSYSGSGITRVNVKPTIWVFNPVTNQYDTYITTSSSGGIGTGNASNIIASGQGFFVQDTSANSSLIFKEACKYSAGQLTGNSLLMGMPEKQQVQQIIRLKLITDSLNTDDIGILFNQSGSVKYDGNEDARYIPGLDALEGLSSSSADGVLLSINCLPLPKQAPQVIRLNVTAAKSGRYTLQRTDLKAIPRIYEVWLMDNYKKDSLDIRNNTNYIFDINLSDTASFGSNRFCVVLRQKQALAVHLLDFKAIKANDGAQVNWKTENEENYTYFTVERSTDNGKSFNALGGFISYAAGKYSLLDKTALPLGVKDITDEYRLKMEDINGTVTYSNVETLVYSANEDNPSSDVTVYPNPASNFINIIINPNTVISSSNLSAYQNQSFVPQVAAQTAARVYSMKILNVVGSMVRAVNSSSAEWHCDVSDFAPGVYIIQVTESDTSAFIGKASFIKL